MKLAFILFTIAFIIIVVGTVAKARKLDNLHKRIEHMRHRLDRALLQRAACALGIARSGVLDPASSLLLEEAALEALHAVDAPGRHGERSLVESNLSQVIKATAAYPGRLGVGLHA